MNKDLEEVDLKTIPLPLCKECGAETYFEIVAITIKNPLMQYIFSHFLFKPKCTLCGHTMIDWDEETLYSTDVFGDKAYRFKR